MVMARRASNRKSGILVLRGNNGLMTKAKAVKIARPKVVPVSRRVIFSRNSFNVVKSVVPKAAGMAKMNIVDSKAIISQSV